MVVFWRKAKAVHSAKLAIAGILSFLECDSALECEPGSQRAKISGKLWTDPYFIGFFYNIVRYWARRQLAREPKSEEFRDIFFRAIRDSCGSNANAEAASDALRNNFSKMLGAAELASGKFCAQLINDAGSKESASQAMNDLERHLDAAESARDFLNGGEMGRIYVGLVTGSSGYDRDSRLSAARLLASRSGADVSTAHLAIAFKREYKERYADSASTGRS
jgi:hypothetical protein